MSAFNIPISNRSCLIITNLDLNLPLLAVKAAYNEIGTAEFFYLHSPFVLCVGIAKRPLQASDYVLTTPIITFDCPLKTLQTRLRVLAKDQFALIRSYPRINSLDFLLNSDACTEK